MVKTRLKKFVAGMTASLVLPLIAFAPLASAAATTTTITQTSTHGWSFNGDPSTATPYTFSEAKASIGEGSLYVSPIGSNPADKFIAAKTLNVPVNEIGSVSYDFLIAGDGEATDVNQFYLNVYTNLPDSNTFYDCRFDYVPASGLTTDFTTASFNTTSTPVNIGDRLDAFTCPATLSGMPIGSTVKFIAINVGDTSSSDIGLAGYIDNVIISTTGDVMTYDFEQDPIKLSNEEACKNGGWMISEDPVFKNQGNCVSYFASQGKAKSNPVVNQLRY